MSGPGEAGTFARGDVVMYRTLFVTENGECAPAVADVRPSVVVDDTPELLSLWLPPGTPTKLTQPIVPGQPRPWVDGEWELVDAVWERWNMLSFKVPDRWYATWVWWTPDWEFLGWYVNLEETLRRTPLGFDVRDLWLDIVVDADRGWRWKDEDEVERVVARGLMSEEVADHIRRVGEAVIVDIERGAWPFTDDMRAWRPDPSWPTPTHTHIPEAQLLAIHDEPHWTNPRRL